VKILLDQNLSHRLVPLLAKHFPRSKHILDLGLVDADDEVIWRYALSRGFAIISKDSDFMHRSLIRGHPPKVIQLQVGNASTDQISMIIIANKNQILRSLRDKTESLLILR